MKFMDWWSEQPPFNKTGIAFVAAVLILLLLVAIF